jgi:hypothetical protein
LPGNAMTPFDYEPTLTWAWSLLSPPGGVRRPAADHVVADGASVGRPALVDVVRGIGGQLGFVSRLVNSTFGQQCLGPSEPGRYYVLWLSGRCRVGDRAVEGAPDLRLAAAGMDHANQGLHADLVQRGGRVFLEQLKARVAVAKASTPVALYVLSRMYTVLLSGVNTIAAAWLLV